MVNIIISLAVLDAICIVLVQGLVRGGFDVDFKGTLLTALSILIAAVPIALPLVLQVTMAIGAYRMATDHHAIVTRMSALQDIASMDVLCSDKTGTLTTAKMSINLEKIWPAKADGFNLIDPYLYKAPNQDLALQQMLMVMGILAGKFLTLSYEVVSSCMPNPTTSRLSSRLMSFFCFSLLGDATSIVWPF